MKRAIIAVSIVLSLLAVAVGIAPGGAGVAGAADPTSSGLATSDVVFSEDFEGAFPGSKWFVGDMNSLSGEDYWGAAWTAEAARAHQGNWSGWCAEEGTNSLNGDVPNFSIRAYDYNMDAFMHQAWSYSVDLSAADLAYLDFYAWCQTESVADYLSLEWYDEGSGTWVNDSNQRLTGTHGWGQYLWQTPYAYMTSGALFGFLFHSDFSEVYEGVYLDEINLNVADVSVESDSYADAAYARPGDTFTLHYHIHNPAPFSVQCGLGARIAGMDAPVGYHDAAHDTVVTIPSGYSWQTRTFTVPSGIPPEFGAPDGLYNIIFEIWSGTPDDTTNGNRFWGYSESADTLRVDTVAPDPPTLISPANGATINDNIPSFDWSDVTDPSGVYYFIQVDDDADFSSPVIGTPATGLEVPSSQYTAPSALADGRYYWRVAAEDRLGNSSSPSTVWYFDVDTSEAPTVTTIAATLVGPAAATLNGNLAALGTATSDNVSFEWGLTTSYGNTTTAQAMTATGTFSDNLTGLTANTTYHFRAKAVGDGTTYGDDVTFTTGTTAPSVTTIAATLVGPAAATLNGNLAALGTATSDNVSFEWGLTTAYGSATTPQTLTATGAFSSPLSGLTPATTYHFRAIAVGDGTTYGDHLTFTTNSTSAPAVTTGAATLVGPAAATLNGNLATLGTATSDNVSFEWGLTTSYGNTTTPQAMTATGTFSAPLTGLTANTTYHFRAEAVGEGTTYGDDLTFTTLAAVTLPSVTTSASTNVAATSAILNGNLATLGTAASVSVSFEWGPTLSYGSETSPQSMSAKGTFSANPTGLTANTTYHFRAKAVGDGSAVYGDDMTFTTASLADTTAPVISSVKSSGITVSGATITWTTDEPATSQVEYGLTEEYGSVKTMASDPVTSHSVDLTGLKAGKTYHYRVMSKDAANNEAVSADATLTTTAPSGGGMPTWAWVLIGLAAVGVVGGAAYFIGTRQAKK